MGEFYYGAFRSAHREKQLEQMRRFLRAAVVVGTDAQTSERYGRIRAELAQAGLPIPENDIWIAAVALQHGWPLARSFHGEPDNEAGHLNTLKNKKTPASPEGEKPA